VFRLRLDEPVSDGIRRIALGQIDDILDRLEGRSGDDLGTAIHESRKSLKRLRTVVRLVEAELGEELSAHENAAFRDAGRMLSGPRDSQVMVEAFDAVLERYGVGSGAADLAGFRSRLVRSHERIRAELTAGAPALAEVERAIRAARGRVDAWPLEQQGFDLLAPGLRRAYRRGRRARRAALEEPTPERLHEWRKGVKDLWYSVQIVEGAGPRRLKPLVQSTHELSELLGDDHDLVLLEQQDASQTLRSLTERRRGELQVQAFELGEALYRDAPGAFVRRIQKGWRKRAGAS
jgi:CHAD domain-containing protein